MSKERALDHRKVGSLTIAEREPRRHVSNEHGCDLCSRFRRRAVYEVVDGEDGNLVPHLGQQRAQGVDERAFPDPGDA